MQNDIIFCDRCGCELTRDSVHYFEDEYLCSDCLDDSTIVCSYCGERIWSDDNAGTMSMPLCDHCYDNHYTSCEDCGRIIHQDYANYYDDDDCPYCDNCFSHRNEGPIRDYSYKPDPEFFGEGDRYFGVELEIDGAGECNSNDLRIFLGGIALSELIYQSLKINKQF